MRKVLVGFMFLVSMVLFASGVASADMYLFGYTPGEAMGGGLRFDVGEGRVVDLSATGGSGDSGSTYSLYGDYFIGLWGLGVTVKKATPDASVELYITPQLALEQPINEKISAGVLVALANYDTTGGADPKITFFPAIVPYFILGF